MVRNKKDDQFFADLIDIMNGLLNQQNDSDTVNPPIPSINNLFQRNNTITLSEDEANRLLHMFKSLAHDLEEKEKVINNLQNQKLEENNLLNKLEDLNKEIEEKKNKIDRLGEENSKLIREKEKLYKYKKGAMIEEKRNNSLAIDCYFKEELEKHVSNLDFITLILLSGSKCCEVCGYPCKIYSDFLVLVNDNKELIKIPINKIVAIKVNNGGGGNRSSKENDLDNNNEISTYSKMIKEKQEQTSSTDQEGESIATVAEQDESQIEDEQSGIESSKNSKLRVL